MEINKLSIVIPAYNEEKTIAQIIRKVLELNLSQWNIAKEILVVNDASQDRTAEIVSEIASRQKDIKLLNHNKNIGKSQSVKTGILASTGDLVVIQDADLEYNPENFIDFITEFLKDKSLDVVYGNRFGKDNDVIYWQNWIGNRALTLISNIFTMWKGFWISDMEVCYKMARGDHYRKLAATIKSTSNFGFEPEITAKFAKSNVKYLQLPIDYSPRTIAEGKHMNAWKDGLKALGEIVRFNLVGKTKL